MVVAFFEYIYIGNISNYSSIIVSSMVCRRQHANKRNTCIYYFPLPPLILHIFSRHLTTLTHSKCIHPLLCTNSSGATGTRERRHQWWIPLKQTDWVQCCRTKAYKCFFPHFKLHLFRINTAKLTDQHVQTDLTSAASWRRRMRIKPEVDFISVLQSSAGWLIELLYLLVCV